MYSYALLETGCHYLVQEKEDGQISLIKVTLETDYCMFITRFAETEVMEWKKKSDPIVEILELLSDDKVREWQSVYNNNQDAYYEEDED